MWIRIFNVEHGFFACVGADNRNLVVLDCGHNATTGFRPSDYLRGVRCDGIEYFVITNYDNDHVSDLHNILGVFPIQVVAANRSIPVDVLRQIKLRGGPLSSGLRAMCELLEIATVENPVMPDLSGLEMVHFCNPYPVVQDTNDLSLVTFLHYRDVGIVFPGDLTVVGWEMLLRRPDFRAQLGRVGYFVASHHGRKDGYCCQVFDHCHPHIVVISDETIQYDTQNVDYSSHASGMNFGGQSRRVFTTRADGCIKIYQEATGGPFVMLE